MSKPQRKRVRETLPDDPSQSEAFIAKARELEADGDGSGADKLMGRMAKMRPEPRPAKIKKPA